LLLSASATAKTAASSISLVKGSGRVSETTAKGKNLWLVCGLLGSDTKNSL
jgi:hypothetical protein